MSFVLSSKPILIVAFASRTWAHWIFPRYWSGTKWKRHIPVSTKVCLRNSWNMLASWSKARRILYGEQSQIGLAARKFLQDSAQYQWLVGRLIYLTLTRPELSCSIHILSQFMQAPGEIHMEAAGRVFHYLKGNHGKGILLRTDSNLWIVTFCDSDWGAHLITRKSLTSYFVTLGEFPISCRTKK